MKNSKSLEVLEQTSGNEFDWDLLEAIDKNGRYENKNIKKKNSNDRVFSHQPYAQEMYDLIYSQGKYVDVKPLPEIGSLVSGVIDTVSQKEATVNIGYREHARVIIQKERSDYKEYLKPGNELEFVIVDDGKNENGIVIGLTKAISIKKEEVIKEHVNDTSTAFKGYTKELINGGYVVDIDGVEAFMPGSLAAINKLHDFNELLHTYIYVVPVTNYSDDNLLIVSREEYLKTLIPNKVQQLNELNWDNNWLTGHVTGTTKFGVFVEFWECLTGMVYHTDLVGETNDKYQKRLLKPGDSINFRVKQIVNNYKIILTQNEPTEWAVNLKEGENYEGEIVFEKRIGYFVKLDEDVIGLIHSSVFEKSNNDPYKKGDQVTVKIEKIDRTNKQIDLTPIN